METHLEIKHLVPYFPYELECMVSDYCNGDNSTNEPKRVKLNAIWSDNSYSFFGLVESDRGFDKIMPILRPISDFNKTIEHSGYVLDLLYEIENDKKIEWFDEEQAWSYLLKYEHKIESTDFIPYGIMEKLFEYHFDVFGLIEKGLAVDINTIN